jgi:hypothetical protein
LILVCSVLLTRFAFAVERYTDEIGADTIDRLIQTRRLDDARWLCETQLGRFAASEFEYAKWTARLVRVHAEDELVSLFDGPATELIARLDEATRRSCQPGADWLTANPESPLADFMVAGLLQARQRLLRAAIVSATISPREATPLNDLLQRIARLQSDIDQQLARNQQRLARRRDQLDKQARGEFELAADQFKQLESSLKLARIRVLMLQVELFEEGSNDHTAAAVEAAKFAKQTVLAFRPDAPARRTAMLWFAEALLESGRIGDAERLIDTALENDDAESAAWLALKVLLQLNKGDVDGATSTADKFYGASPKDAPQSPEMDFAKLQILLASEVRDATLGRWIDFVEARGGAFARRRAEAITLQRMREGTNMTGGSETPVSAALMAAQGEDWLRRGQPERAISLLKEASKRETKPDQAFQYAAKAAAIAIKQDAVAEAVSLLRDVSRKHSATDDAADWMLQAARLASKPGGDESDPAARLSLLKETLTEAYQTWPRSDVAFEAYAWLRRILIAEKKRRDAAYAALEWLSFGRSERQLPIVADAWFEWLQTLDPERAGKELSVLSESLRELSAENSELGDAVSKVSVWLFDRADVLPRAETGGDGKINQADASAAFRQQLRDLRTGRSNQFDAQNISPQMVERVRWRLRRDALLDPNLQRAIGSVLSNWPDATDWEQAEAKLWETPQAKTIGQIRELAMANGGTTETLQRGMSVLGASVSGEAKRAAVQLADRLASKLPLGSDRWYELKLRAIRWLSEAREREQAQKRAAYLLLTRPPDEPALRKEFETFAGRSS